MFLTDWYAEMTRKIVQYFSITIRRAADYCNAGGDSDGLYVQSP